MTTTRSVKPKPKRRARAVERANDGTDTPKMRAVEALDEREMALCHERAAFLRTHGWTYSSDYPDYRWRWSKVIGDRCIAEDLRGAISLESFLP